ncbi:hypothetical protein BX667DRAFT_495457 [Coemansia mojavensis]|nr:hypothetical protein BX667DRAFT_495457 [Coemansia mojavensis]
MAPPGTVGFINMAGFFSAILFLFSLGCYACMLAYTILNLPKNLMSISIGLTQFLMGVLSLMALFMALPTETNKLPTLVFRGTPLMNCRFLIVLHISIGTMIISDSLFLKEKTPNSRSGPIGSVLYQLLIAGAAAQAAGILAHVIAHFQPQG